MKQETKKTILQYFNSTLKRDIFIIFIIIFIGSLFKTQIILSPFILLFLMRIYVGLLIHIGRKNIIVFYNKNKKNFKNMFNDFNDIEAKLYRKINNQNIVSKNIFIILIISLSILLTLTIVSSTFTLLFIGLISYFTYYYIIDINGSNIVKFPKTISYIYSIDKKGDIMKIDNTLIKKNIPNKSLSFFEIFEELIFIYNFSNPYIDKFLTKLLEINRK